MKPHVGKHETLRYQEWENMKPHAGKHETLRWKKHMWTRHVKAKHMIVVTDSLQGLGVSFLLCKFIDDCCDAVVKQSIKQMMLGNIYDNMKPHEGKHEALKKL